MIVLEIKFVSNENDFVSMTADVLGRSKDLQSGAEASEFEDTIIVGTRGWSFEQDEESKRILNREACRLENSIMYAKEKFGEEKEMICMLHYPPLTKDLVDNKQDSIFTEILKKYNINKCYYGHLHAESHKNAIEGIIDGIEYKLISSDYLKFDLFKIV